MASMSSLRSLLVRSPPLHVRSISSTPPLESLGWIDKIKGVFTGKKPSAPSFSLIGQPLSLFYFFIVFLAPFLLAQPTPVKFTGCLPDFADQMQKARSMGMLKKFQVGRCSETTMANAFQKQSSILRYLGAIDPNGENIQHSHKLEATKHCNCTMSEVEHILSKYKWAKDAQKKIEKLKEEGKPMPTSFSQVQKLMGSTPLDVARSNLSSKSGKIGRQVWHGLMGNLTIQLNGLSPD
ncbi:hypothetical protein AXF42_Ash008033 [Apostasia shenzhenica]|uniref:Uncharacterized protein n=1 Tax=Apostasia shenzhenica TaxID=1088818 RepID=A0A2I0A8F0_9ASPA|nr:hypothetical protein AXF42_Ash008033 [Apostasia shenzhenica]